jgi:glucan biosynthesis protein C
MRRVFYIDNVRVVLTALVVLHHLAITYGGEGDWFYREPPTGPIAAMVFLPFVAINQAFFMGFFFLIAAYLTPRSLERKGFGRFLADRLMRLGIPLVFYTVVINPFVLIMLEVHERGFRADYVVRNWVSAFGVGPMWFVQLLLFFTIAYAFADQIRPRSRPSVAAAPSRAATIILALAMGVITFAVRIWVPVGRWTPILHVQLAHVTQYAFLFCVGIAASRNGWLEKLQPDLARFWRIIFGLASAVMVGVLFLGGAFEEGLAPFLGGLDWRSLINSLWEQITCVAIIINMIVWFRGRHDSQGRLLQAAAAGSYTVYIIHPVILVSLGLALSGLGLPSLLKFAVAAPLALVLCFSTANLIRQLPLARRIL